MIDGIIKTTANELNLSLTLRSGQAFRWRPIGDHWLGVVGNRFVIQLRQKPVHIEYKVLNPLEDCLTKSGTDVIKESPDNLTSDQKPKKRQKTNPNLSRNKFYEDLIRNYFRLDINLSDLYKDWSKCDKNFC